MDVEKYLNKIVDGENAEYTGPDVLYKYRPFDEHTFDMLENNYVFLCKAANLDDPSECTITVTAENLYDIENDCLRRECAEKVLEMARPFTTAENFEKCRSILYQVMAPDFTIRNNFLLEASFQLQELMPDFDIAPLVNWLAAIPKRLESPEIKPQIEALILKGLTAREKTGICSLAEVCDIDDMWENYAEHFSGYCVEYDMTNYEHSNLLCPVVYEDLRETNLIMQVVAMFVGQMVTSLSNHEIEADRSQFLRLFVTKDAKWTYQREWRLIGDANAKLTAPPIRRIIIGSNVAENNLNRLAEFCKTKRISCSIRK